MRSPLVVACALVLALAGGLSACATAHQVATLPGGVTVHTFRRDHNNAHVVVAGAAAVLIDAGLAASAPALDADLRRAGLDPARLRAVVITHGHADHAGGAGFFRARYRTPIIAGRGDAAMLAAGRNDPLCPTDLLGRRQLAEHQGATFPGLAADHWVDAELDLAALTGVPGRVVALPGHTRGSLVIDLGAAAIIGDLARGRIALPGAARHFYMCDLDDNDRDLAQVLYQLAPAATRFFTGHFGPVDRADLIELLWERARQRQAAR